MTMKALNAAKKKKDDEFYTPYETVKNELDHYSEHLKGKKIYLPCDDYEWSSFTQYFRDNFKRLELHCVASTCKNLSGKGKGKYSFLNEHGEFVGELNYDGRFSNPECQDFMASCDVVITNPPFSLYRKFVKQILDFGKDFIIMGDQNACKYKVQHKQITRGEIRMTFFKQPNEFRVPDGRIVKLGAVVWYTNLQPSYAKQPLILTKRYDPNVQIHCINNPDIIWCKSIRDIPYDYDGMIAAPVNILRWDYLKDFEHIGFCQDFEKGGLTVDNFNSYTRVIIRKRK